MTDVLPGSYRLAVTLPTESKWSLRSALAGGRDVLDFGLDVGDGADAAPDITVTLSERRSQVQGLLLTPTAVPATEYHLVVIPSERAYWRPASRRLAVARPDTDGRFAFADLPPGDYFLAALSDFDADDWPALDLLESLLPGSVAFALADGERKVQDIRVAGAR